MRKTLLPLIAALLLTSCAAATPSEPAVTPHANPCAFLPLPNVSQDMRDRLAADIDAAPSNAVWPGAVQQWLALRAAVKACKGNS